MTGPEHYAEAERLLALADRHGKGATYSQEWGLTLSAAHVHATLALAAATAVGAAGPDGRAWTEAAAAKPSTSKPQTPGARSPEPGPARRPPPLFPPPEPGPRHLIRQPPRLIGALATPSRPGRARAATALEGRGTRPGRASPGE